MLAKDANDRFADMEGVAAALAPEIARAPVPRPSDAPPPERTRPRGSYGGTTLSAASAAVSTESIDRGRRRGMRFAVAAAAISLVVGVVVTLRGGRTPSSASTAAAEAPAAPGPATPAAAAPAVAAPAAPGPTAAEATIEAKLESTPSGALVTVDGVAIGTTPMTWRTAASGRPTTLTFSLDGYRREVIQALPAAGLRLAPALKRVSSHHARPANTPPRPAPRPVDDIKSER
jgi:hypothetical protein